MSPSRYDKRVSRARYQFARTKTAGSVGIDIFVMENGDNEGNLMDEGVRMKSSWRGVAQVYMCRVASLFPVLLLLYAPAF